LHYSLPIFVRRRDVEHLDVVAARGEQTRHSRQGAHLVLQKERNNVALARSHSGSSSRRPPARPGAAREMDRGCHAELPPVGAFLPKDTGTKPRSHSEPRVGPIAKCPKRSKSAGDGAPPVPLLRASSIADAQISGENRR